jgi:hypothetical protein
MSTTYPKPSLPPPLQRSLVGLRDEWPIEGAMPFERFVTPTEPEELPPCDRPRRVVAYRAVVAGLAMVAVILSVQISDGASGSVQGTNESLRLAAFIIGVSYVLLHVTFALWTARHRRIIDDFKWRSFRRDAWNGWWATGWVVAPVAAGALFAVMTVVDTDAAGAVAAGIVLLVVRAMMVQSHGTNMGRVVFRARHWLMTWGVSLTVADLFVFGIVVNAFQESEPRRESLALIAGWAPVALVVAGLLQLVHMKRVERWVMEWWDHRFGMTEQDVLNVLSVVRPLGGMADDFSGRRLAPTYLLRFVLMASYAALALAALWSAGTIWAVRDELSAAVDADATFDKIAEAATAFLFALLIMQIVQGLWCVAQAWNAQRCTLDAPNPLGMATLFLLGPAVLVFGIALFPDAALAITSFALLVNLGCWAFSFGALGQTAQILGRSAQPIMTWSAVVAFHWVLGFVTRPLVLIGDDTVFAGFVALTLIVDAAIWVVASVYAWHAMRGLELAARDYEQIRRVRV